MTSWQELIEQIKTTDNMRDANLLRRELDKVIGELMGGTISFEHGMWLIEFSAEHSLLFHGPLPRYSSDFVQMLSVIGQSRFFIECNEYGAGTFDLHRTYRGNVESFSAKFVNQQIALAGCEAWLKMGNKNAP